MEPEYTQPNTNKPNQYSYSAKPKLGLWEKILLLFPLQIA